MLKEGVLDFIGYLLFYLGKVVVMKKDYKGLVKGKFEFKI